MSQVIDRRLNGRNKSAVNRTRFIRRFKSQIRKAASDAVAGRSVTDIDSGERVRIPRRDITEPAFRHGPGGQREQVHPGNTDFIAGDRIARPPGGAGAGSGPGEPGDQPGGEDDFVFELTRDEFLECFFEDLELPDLVKTQLKQVVEMRSHRAGFSRSGVPANINITRSLRGALARRIALRGPYRERLQKAREELEELRAKGLGDGVRARELDEEIRRLEAHIDAIPFIDDFDLRYHNRVQHPVPTTQAVMFCLMDVSGSMDQERKDIAKRFFILLYLFLMRAYERIEVVFIRHHVNAKEVDEEEFFGSRESGGTVVSSALKLMLEVARARYPVADWNIYVAQASDGENWAADSELCRELLLGEVLPLTQFFAYAEIRPHAHASLWQAYARVAEASPRLAMQVIQSAADIYPVFRRFLAKRAA